MGSVAMSMLCFSNGTTLCSPNYLSTATGQPSRMLRLRRMTTYARAKEDTRLEIAA